MPSPCVTSVHPIPSFAFINRFDASSSLMEKVCRVANSVVFAAAAYGAYAILRGEGSLLWGAPLALAARKVALVSVGYAVYPAAALTRGSEEYRCGLKKQLDRGLKVLTASGFVTRRLKLVKSGVTYDAVMAGHGSILGNGRWTVHALGNGMDMESSLLKLAQENFKRGANTLLINGPSVGESEGVPTPYQMGAGFEAGLQYLESVVRATHIIMDGFSLGNGMMSQAILTHDFTKGLKDGTEYLAISDRTFSRLSDIASVFVSRLVKPLVWLLGADLDGVAAARKLSELGIRQIVVQHKASTPQARPNDGVIPDPASLAEVLQQEKPPLGHKQFLESNELLHNYPIPTHIEGVLRKEVRLFLRAD